jgi:hypothetical protein
MKTVDFIRMGLEFGGTRVLELIDDVKDQPFTFPTPKGGNHPLWILGHLAWAEGFLLQVMLDRPNPLAHWKELFGPGSEPTADATRYPSFEEARKLFLEQRAKTLSLLNELTDADLDRPSKGCPPDFVPVLGTYGQCFLMLVLHPQMHRGQVTDARRALGRKPLKM